MVNRREIGYQAGVEMPSESWPQRLRQALFAPIELAPLIYFRLVFGAILLWEVTRFFDHDWISRYYIEPSFYFTYRGFDWVAPWPGNYMYLHFGVLGILAACIFLGLAYRFATVLFFLGFSYVFLLDQANYLNHFYLVAWISFLLIWVPAHRGLSLDATLNPSLRASRVSAWWLYLLRAQIAVPYFFGGIAKINSDWLQGEPMRAWLLARTDFPVIGEYFMEPLAAYFFSYSGMLFDLFVAPMLLWRRTRVLAVLLILTFHLTNAQLFQIGIFPWFMLFVTPIFFEPERLAFLRRLETWFTGPSGARDVLTPAAWRGAVLACLAAFVALHVLVPFRHHLYPGNVNWTEEGHRFSWHMKLRDKNGDIQFLVYDPARDQRFSVDARAYLSRRQFRKMRNRPEMILLFSHHLEERLRAEGRGDVEVYARAAISLNGRPLQLMIDPEADLTQHQRSIWPASWILPLETPLREPADDDES